MTCALAWLAALGAWVPTLRLLARLGYVWPLPRRVARVGRTELRLTLAFGVVGMSAALALVVANDC